MVISLISFFIFSKVVQYHGSYEGLAAIISFSGQQEVHFVFTDSSIALKRLYLYCDLTFVLLLELLPHYYKVA